MQKLLLTPLLTLLQPQPTLLLMQLLLRLLTLLLLLVLLLTRPRLLLVRQPTLLLLPRRQPSDLLIHSENGKGVISGSRPFCMRLTQTVISGCGYALGDFIR